MKPTLQFRLSQHLTLTPQLQQSIRLLQLSTVELNQEIERLLMENPILEREDEEPAPPPREAGTAPAPETPAPAQSEPAERADDLGADFSAPWRGEDDSEDGDRTHAAADNPTLREHLNGQLNLVGLEQRDRAFVSLL